MIIFIDAQELNILGKERQTIHQINKKLSRNKKLKDSQYIFNNTNHKTEMKLHFLEVVRLLVVIIFLT